MIQKFTDNLRNVFGKSRNFQESLDLAKECAHLMDEEDELSFEPKYPKEMRRNIWMKIG